MSQREQLQAEINTLTAERDELDARLQNAASTPEYNAIQQQITAKNEAISMKKEQLERLAVATETAIAAIENEFETLEIEGILIRDLFVSQTHFEFFTGWWKETRGKEAADQAALESSYKSEIESQEETIAELEGYKAEADRLGGLLADMTAKRDAAGVEIEELKQEVTRLTTDNESLRKQLEAKQYMGPTNISANLSELAKQLKQSLPGIYNKRWKDGNNKKTYLANLSTTGKEIEIPWLEIGKYREESAEDAARFREEQAQKELERVAEEAIANPVEPVTPELSFQDENDTLQTDTTNREVADPAITRTEYRLRDLEERVARLEQQTGSRAVA